MAQKPRENKATEGREKVPERWSAQQKTEVVLRLLRGEDLVEVSARYRSHRRSWRNGGGCSWRPVSRD